MTDCMELRKQLIDRLPLKRYYHSVGVADTAACLAMCYECDRKKAEIAGLLHDIAKPLSDEDMLRECRTNHIEITDSEERAPYLLHGKLGAYYAARDYGIEDQDLLSAITWHTTGHPDMTLLEKIIFAADYMEPTRKTVPGLDEVRKIIFHDLDNAVFMILDHTLHYLTEIGAPIDPITEITRDFYCNKQKKYVVFSNDVTGRSR